MINKLLRLSPLRNENPRKIVQFATFLPLRFNTQAPRTDSRP